MKGKIKGFRIDCITTAKTEVELEYEVKPGQGGKVFQLLGGPLGTECFYLWKGIAEQVSGIGWNVNGGNPSHIDSLFIPAEEMRKAMEAIGALPAAEAMLA